jgi:hypothetical protein
MPGRSHRYAHVPLAVISLLTLLAIISWLLAERFDLWRSVTRPPSPVVAVPAGAPVPPDPAASGGPGPSVPATSPPGPARPAAEAERFALESGPFGTPEAADRAEDRLSQLGHATVRFRSHQAHRDYVVAAAGFATVAEAAEAARRLGRGQPRESEGVVELLLHRAPSMGEALAAAGTVQGLGLDVRVREEVTPRVHYVIRYGEFPTRAAAEAHGAAVGEQGVASRVVKLRAAPPPLRPRTAGSGAPPGAAP